MVKNLACAGDEILNRHPAQREQQFRPMVQPRAHTIEHGRDVLAHGSPVRAGAGKGDVLRAGEEAGLLAADALHDAFGQTPLEQFHQGFDSPGTVLANRAPGLLGHRCDLDVDLVDFGPTDQGRDFAVAEP